MTATKLNIPRFGWLELATEAASPLPLERTGVSAQLIGPLACVAVTQHFSNPFNTIVELKYLFPLPHEAALIDFELKIGDRLISGDLQEIKEAQKIYSQALEEGKIAGLLEERRPNLFAVKIANVQPGENIQAVLRYQHRITYQGGAYEFVFPMGITPKYNSKSHPEEGEGVDAPIAGADEIIGTVTISVAVDAGTEVSDVESPSHPIKVDYLDDRRFNLCITEDCVPDHDFVLRYSVAREAVALTGWRTSGNEGDYFLASLLPPPIEQVSETTIPREFIFVLDRSGSMRGEPISQARNALRACLRTLNENDTFRILLFDDRIEWYRSEPSSASQEQIDQADKFLDTVEGRGGTIIVAALNASLTLPPYPDRTRFVVFLTDGAVSAEERALSELRKNIGKARLFTFGIGPSVNRAMLSALARLGRGMAEFLQLDEDIESAILRFQDRISFPVLTDLKPTWQKAKAWDVYPSRLPDLYVDQPLEISGRLLADKGSPAVLKVSGLLEDKKIDLVLSLPPVQTKEVIIERIWARNRLDDLLEQQSLNRSRTKLQSEIISHALEYDLISPYTAFVAVDTIPTDNKAKPTVINISQPLPKGLDIDGFMGSMRPKIALASINNLRGADMHISDNISLANMAFMRAQPSREKTINEHIVTPETLSSSKDTLKQLARTQKMNGSWENDIELTIAALFCFFRNGHTTNKGSYRKQVGRALKWLLKAQTSGFIALALAKLIMELSSQTGLKDHQRVVTQMMSALPKPITPIEIAVYKLLQGETVAAPQSISTLDDLRLSALLNIKRHLPPELFKGPTSGLAHAWAGTIIDV